MLVGRGGLCSWMRDQCIRQTVTVRGRDTGARAQGHTRSQAKELVCMTGLTISNKEDADACIIHRETSNSIFDAAQHPYTLLQVGRHH